MCLGLLMLRYGKTARQAVAAMSYLAECETQGGRLVSSSEVGEARGMPSATAAKLLSMTASAGLTVGITGPKGGYRLSRSADSISLADIVWIFEKKPNSFPCPLGPDYCNNETPCPLHHEFARIEKLAEEFLNKTTLAVFLENKGHNSL